MKIFYLDKVADVFNGPLPRDLDELTHLADGAPPPAGIEQFFSIENHDGIQIRWLGLRTSAAGRLLGAMVKKKGSERYFFALEFTPTHDYEKTFVRNPSRLASFRQLILGNATSMVPIKKLVFCLT